MTRKPKEPTEHEVRALRNTSALESIACSLERIATAVEKRDTAPQQWSPPTVPSIPQPPYQPYWSPTYPQWVTSLTANQPGEATVTAWNKEDSRADRIEKAAQFVATLEPGDSLSWDESWSPAEKAIVFNRAKEIENERDGTFY